MTPEKIARNIIMDIIGKIPMPESGLKM